ncbi:g patch domain containing 8 [Moniliophthora roreri MCA 2997]|uniref:G patch domain containing 8 n=1 Tax=Moniliophthora roreri (strain MCA 2997) TaxID=1381753 RepID=V2Z372_MONRO|nr:g patch domain containing 8 [Moniliophthora roreri MCA 2997]
MSQSTIARWNAIPLTRPEQPKSLKHPRPEDDDEDDDISIASRTPSPPPDAMEVDEDVNKYDEYVRAPAREVITVETKIKSTNRGFAMLAKLGWTEGQPLGLSADARVDPIPFQMKSDSTGIGKANQDVRMIESTVSQRRELDSERQQKETQEQRQAREDAVARRSALASELSDTLRAFYCTLCDKQFQNVAQYDEHTNSYAHHHKARAKDMQANIRLKPQAEIDKRKEKERKREEKELRKMAAASGIKISKQSSTSLVGTVTPTVSLESIGGTASTSGQSSGGSWSSISSGSLSGFKKSGWATVGSSTTSISKSPPPPVESPHPPPSSTIQSPFPGGWTSLDTSMSAPGPTETSTPLPAAVPQPPAPVQQTLPSSSWNSNSVPPDSAVSVLSSTSVPKSQSQSQSESQSHNSTGRGGWQQFQKSNAKRR